MSNVNKNITVEEKFINPPTYIKGIVRQVDYLLEESNLIRVLYIILDKENLFEA